jgi:hypothetical protein
MHKLTILFLLTIFSVLIVNSQTVTINAQVVFCDVKDTSNYIRFKMNNQSFGERDTLIKIHCNTKGFDTCEAIIVNDTMRFLTKFKMGVSYEIKQGCCCAAFTLEPTNNPRRGTVTFNNTTKRDLGLIIAESNIDTVKTNKRQTTFSYESALCRFKPCSILITETPYLSEVYDYNSDKRNYDSLWKEQAQFILSKTWFHFLHGEKIALVYNDRTKDVKIRLIGYMSDEEYYKFIWK